MLGDNFGSVGWPASGEIDIMENIGREPNTVHGTLHGPGLLRRRRHRRRVQPARRRRLRRRASTRSAVDWEPNAITCFVDGVSSTARLTPADPGGNAWVFNHPFFMILNVAVGGYWPG